MIRDACSEDAEVAARLAGELGYPLSIESARERISRLNIRSDHRILVALDGEVVVGWIEIAITDHFVSGTRVEIVVSGTRVEIAGLVVTESARGRGIGAKLVEAAETWAREKGIFAVLVRSQIKRQRAHEFYRKLGFQRSKTQEVFVKQVQIR